MDEFDEGGESKKYFEEILLKGYFKVSKWNVMKRKRIMGKKEEIYTACWGKSPLERVQSEETSRQSTAELTIGRNTT